MSTPSSPFPPSAERTFARLLSSADGDTLRRALRLLKGVRNGAVYGVKIRAPHAFVMTFLFRDGTLGDKLRLIARLTYQHARNLATFVFLYKSLLEALRAAHGGKERSVDAAVAGAVGGWYVFGEYSSVNNQINLYLLSRVLTGLAQLGVQRGVIAKPPRAFSVFAAVTWALVMWLFRHHADVLHPSLASSMQYLYNDSEQFDSLRTLLWHN
eukprot:CAMPEP_0198331868 /NCGR_PEP_ID=MMETSP1450-20131203/17889_1 /TAXON_ID=753684 ORGANISM="Madagascaria erythrocladiodes, Strain CCMP3234" /NCGR_SAMPLE_ID=MMETSP1450 /ASSEMBLY_ACC=CAM_ASM_001115 /LENGTH=211 /DNA_ID=CAMNT_0044036285 /DNA_START=63 /DNA_END=695 /DNA_ORIENTATION=+